MSDSVDLEAAALEVREARARLRSTANEIQARLAPARLLDEAVDTARSRTTELALTTADAARRQPRAAIGVVAFGFVLLLRRPLWRLARRISGRRRQETD